MKALISALKMLGSRQSDQDELLFYIAKELSEFDWTCKGVFESIQFIQSNVLEIVVNILNN